MSTARTSRYAHDTAQGVFDFVAHDVFAHPLFLELKPEVVNTFEAFHLRNTQLYILIRSYARQVAQSGRKHYGMKGIMERVRWQTEIETQGDGFKVNNNFASCYARLLAIQEPDMADLFELRRTPGTL